MNIIGSVKPGTKPFPLCLTLQLLCLYSHVENLDFENVLIWRALFAPFRPTNIGAFIWVRECVLFTREPCIRDQISSTNFPLQKLVVNVRVTSAVRWSCHWDDSRGSTVYHRHRWTGIKHVTEYTPFLAKSLCAVHPIPVWSNCTSQEHCKWQPTSYLTPPTSCRTGTNFSHLEGGT